jgi:23S rRNA G2069 N7-methylase RlmK/C1962 C5-methylase RlmI
VDGFLAGVSSLREIELAELQDVAGKKLLHLQCHFGLDTLSWIREGAICTGVDISPLAIEKARELARKEHTPRTGLRLLQNLLPGRIRCPALSMH